MKPIIPLTGWEKKVFAFLCSVAKHTTGSTPAVELRVVGGWVRDKLLGRSTNDIDIVVLHATGPQYALRVRDYANKQRRRRVPGETDAPHVSSVIQFTPNKSGSSFMDTAKVQIDGNSMDFVEVRPIGLLDSRGLNNYETPLEYDAFSRDFTVNSLYYNLHTSTLEDYTTRGLEDLSNKIIRTPIDPDITLRDDPLRAVRAVRFACELGFDLCQSLDSKLRDAEIHKMLGSEVSRERIGVEVVRCMNSDPIKGLSLMQEHGMTKAIFGFEEGFEKGVHRAELALDIASSLDISERVRPSNHLVLVLSSLIWDAELVKLVLHEALRLKKKLQNDVVTSISIGKQVANIALQWRLKRKSSESDEEDLWVQMAAMVHRGGESLWRDILICAALEAGDRTLFEELADHRICQNLCKIYPCVDGWTLQKELNLEPGLKVGDAFRELMKLQFLNFRRSGDITTCTKHRAGFIERLKETYSSSL